MARDLTQKIKDMNRQITTITISTCVLYFILSIIFIYNFNVDKITIFLNTAKETKDAMVALCIYGIIAFMLVAFDLHNKLDNLLFVKRKLISLFIANKLLKPVNQKINKNDLKSENKKIRIIMGIFYDLIERDSWEEKAFHDWGIYFSSVNFTAISYLAAILFGFFVLSNDIDLKQDQIRAITIFLTNVIFPLLGRLMILSSDRKLIDIADHQTNNILRQKNSALMQRLTESGILINAS